MAADRVGYGPGSTNVGRALRARSRSGAGPLLVGHRSALPPGHRPISPSGLTRVALGGDRGQLRAKQAMVLAKAGYALVATIWVGGDPPEPCPHPVSGVEIMHAFRRCTSAHLVMEPVDDPPIRAIGDRSRGPRG